VEKLLARPADGRIKMYVIHRVLQFRRDHPELFSTGDYVPLEAAGERERHVIAFARRAGRESVIIAAGRFFINLGITADSFPASEVWSDTKLVLPADSTARRYVDMFTGREIDAHPEKSTSRLSMNDVFAQMPIAMLVPSA
jgi:(1->4)-alpha-D-glucan 1-alpha-D-glucosylmutase